MFAAIHLEFRLTALNALNHYNFASVDPFIFDAGRVPGTQFAGFGNGFAHPEFSEASGRTVYLGAKITF